MRRSGWIRWLLFALVMGFGLAVTFRGPDLHPLQSGDAVAASGTNGAGLCGTPDTLPLKILRVIVRARPAFTEGLVFWHGALYESTGLYGQSSLQRVDPVSGRSEVLTRLPADQFGEGLARWGGDFLQLTWKQNVLWRWPTQENGIGLAAVTAPYPREGWGLASGSDPRNGLVASDGTNQLYFLDPVTFATTRTILVHGGNAPVSGLNELEFVDGNVQPALWANVWPGYRVVRIDPDSGCVTGNLDLTALRNELTPADKKAITADPDAVPNGIAYDAAHSSLYLTAKGWPIFFEISLPR